MVIYAGLPVDISVSLWLRKQRPRFAQGQPKGCFQMKEFDRTTEDIVPMNEMCGSMPVRSHVTSSSQAQKNVLYV